MRIFRLSSVLMPLAIIIVVSVSAPAEALRICFNNFALLCYSACLTGFNIDQRACTTVDCLDKAESTYFNCKNQCTNNYCYPPAD